LDTSKLSTGDLIAGTSGVALLVFMFLPWYGVDVNVAGVGSASGDANAWQALSFIDILLFLVALAAIAYAVTRATGSLPPDMPAAMAVAGAGGLAVLLILFRIIDLPTPDLPDILDDSVDFGRKIGIFLALIAAAGIAYGGWRSAGEAPATGPARPAPSPPAA
jgi:hypothetical protein